jgi:hypothetical protein
MITTQGSLTMVGLNTTSPTVFWNGGIVPNITSIRVDWEDDEQKVKLKVSDMELGMLAEMTVAGIAVKIGARHG